MSAADSQQPKDPAITNITRYPNRRLYDHHQKKYVTLAQIEELVRAGRTVSVRDSKTGEDLTRSLLTQILLERQPDKIDLFPIGILHLMIRANDYLLRSLQEYFHQSLAYLEAVQKATVTAPVPNPMEWMQAFFPPGFLPLFPFQSSSSPSPDNRGSPPPDNQEQDLAGRLAAMEKRLGELEGGKGES